MHSIGVPRQRPPTFPERTRPAPQAQIRLSDPAWAPYPLELAWCEEKSFDKQRVQRVHDVVDGEQAAQALRVLDIDRRGEAFFHLLTLTGWKPGNEHVPHPLQKLDLGRVLDIRSPAGLEKRFTNLIHVGLERSSGETEITFRCGKRGT